MLCKKCGNEIKEEESFCSKCGKRIKPKGDKKSKKLLYIILGIIILVIVGAVGIVLVTDRNTDTTDNTITNTDISHDTNNTQNQEKQDFKYVQEDSKSYYGKSFKNVDFESFKSNVRKSWFKESLEYDMVMARNKGVFGEKYSEWQMHNDSSTGGYMEEIIFPYLKGNSYIVGKMVDIYYNNDKTNVYGIAIYISDYYLGKIGRSKFLEELDEVINCLPTDFKDEVNKRSNGNSTIYEDFTVGYEKNLKLDNGEEYYLVNIMCTMNEQNTNNSYTTNNSNENINNDISQTNGIRQNVRYNVKGLENLLQSQDTSANIYIEFTNNSFELAYLLSVPDSGDIQAYFNGTYTENGNDIVLNADSLTLSGEKTDIKETMNGKISNNGRNITVTIGNEEIQFEL